MEWNSTWGWKPKWGSPKDEKNFNKKVGAGLKRRGIDKGYIEEGNKEAKDGMDPRSPSKIKAIINTFKLIYRLVTVGSGGKAAIQEAAQQSMRELREELASGRSDEKRRAEIQQSLKRLEQIVQDAK